MKPSTAPFTAGQRMAAEATGTALLLLAVVGAGQLGQRLAGGNAAVILLASSIATAAMLYAVVACFAPVSGAHLNPVLTLAVAARRELPALDAARYMAAQFAGALVGVALANTMAGQDPFAVATRVRSGPAQWLGEATFTFTLLGAVFLCARLRPALLPGVVAAVVGAGFWATPTGFGNPAVTLARAFTDSFSGIRWADVPAFVGAQLLGAGLAALGCGWMLGERPVPAPGSREAAEFQAR